MINRLLRLKIIESSHFPTRVFLRAINTYADTMIHKFLDNNDFEVQVWCVCVTQSFSLLIGCWSFLLVRECMLQCKTVIQHENSSTFFFFLLFTSSCFAVLVISKLIFPFCFSVTFHIGNLTKFGIYIGLLSLNFFNPILQNVTLVNLVLWCISLVVVVGWGCWMKTFVQLIMHWSYFFYFKKKTIYN